MCSCEGLPSFIRSCGYSKTRELLTKRHSVTSQKTLKPQVHPCMRVITLSKHFLTDEFWGSVSGVAETPLLCVMWRWSSVAETPLLCVMWLCLSGQSVFCRLDEKYCVHLQEHRVSRTVRTIEHWRWRHWFLSKRLQPISQRRDVIFYKNWIHSLTGCNLFWRTLWHILVRRDFSCVANVCWLRNIPFAGKGGRPQKKNTSNWRWTK
jgi:hypothetical protein